MTTETALMLAQHRFDEAALALYASACGRFTPPLSVGQVRGGMSNPTFILADGVGKRYVLRKQPPGKLLPSAHAVDREFRVISALWQTAVPVARPYAVPGSRRHWHGFLPHGLCRWAGLAPLHPARHDPAQRRQIYETMIDILAALHQVDYRAVGLEDYGRIGGYMTRQMRRWVQQYEASKTNDIPAMERLMGVVAVHSRRYGDHHRAWGFSPGEYDFPPDGNARSGSRRLGIEHVGCTAVGSGLYLPYYVPDEWRGDITGLDFSTMASRPKTST